MFKIYYELTKPGIIYANAVTLAAGFFLASRGHTNLLLLLETLIGLSLVIACGCVLNNYIDRGIDAHMERTQSRALAAGLISGRAAIMYATVLGVLGFLVLSLYTNLVTVLAAAAGAFVYVVVYSIWKRRSTYGVIIGSVAGAVPPVVGYTAVLARLDLGALILFLIFALWQMPHFYAIALYRLADYKAAGIPVLPVKAGAYRTKIHMALYIIVFIATTLMLPALGFAGPVYFIVAVVMGLAWLGYCIKGFKKNNDDKRWARKMFFISLVVIMFLCVAIAVDSFLK